VHRLRVFAHSKPTPGVVSRHVPTPDAAFRAVRMPRVQEGDCELDA
jgi:hypothetical protein